jgi:ankyrin repeat protein
MPTPVDDLKEAICRGNTEAVRQIFSAHPELRSRINDPVGPFDSPIILQARSREMLDALLDAGADINARSRWWAGSFGLLDNAPPDLAQYAIQRGAIVDIHAASRLGMIDRVQELLAADPALVHARGGDGQTPLHFASTVELAKYLLDHGADIDAKDVDHESTPAQYMIENRQEIVRYLITRACKTDLLMAAALGDESLINQHLDKDPEAIRIRVTDEFFPKSNPHSGGTIYQWTLGWYVSPHQVAKKFGHTQILKLLMDRSPPDAKLINACWLGDDDTVQEILHENLGISATLRKTDQQQLAHAARNNDLEAVRLMLLAGLPIDARGQHGGTPLHWAAWHGNPQMTELLLHKNPPLELLSVDFDATPLQWATHGSENSWHPEKGDYPRTVELLLRAGAKPPAEISATDAVKEVFRRLGFK